jgi:ribosomal protein L20
MKAAGINVDRKVLADMAVLDAEGFAQLAAQAKAAIPAPKAEKKPHHKEEG